MQCEDDDDPMGLVALQGVRSLLSKRTRSRSCLSPTPALAAPALAAPTGSAALLAPPTPPPTTAVAVGKYRNQYLSAGMYR